MAESMTKAENRYSGIPTIRREMKEYHLPEPVFENRRNEFVVILYNDSIYKEKYVDKKTKVTISDENLLEFCREPRTRNDIKEFLHLDTWSYIMRKYLKPLLETGEIELMFPEKPKSRKQKYYTKR